MLNLNLGKEEPKKMGYSTKLPSHICNQTKYHHNGQNASNLVTLIKMVMILWLYG
jgi:hypothetical protein